MKKITKQTWITIGITALGIIVAVVLAYSLPSVVTTKSYDQETLNQDSGQETSLIEQTKSALLNEPHEITKIYLRDNLVGVLTSKDKLEKTLKEVYKADFEADFPDTSIGLGEDVYTVTEQSYYEYENIDDQLMAYLKDNDLFSVLTNKIEFSNGAVIYVKDVDMFTEAREKYLLNFISDSSYQTLKDNKSITPLSDYGEQDINISVNETMTVTEGLAAADDILTTEDEIIKFLSYGYDTTEKEYYTTVDGDTVQGVVAKVGNNLSAQQLITLNPDVLTSESQVLAAGTKLNITYFDSPINVVVTKERLAEENVYPASTKYIYDQSMVEGQQVVEVQQVVGKRNVRYNDTYTNGILTSGEEVSSVTTVQPVQGVVRVGVGAEVVIDYNSGSGQFWYPVKNPMITCTWYCYSGHQAIDVVNRYDSWGLVYAADAGTVITNEYNYINGNYMIISHGGGFYTYYGHMRTHGFYEVGETVTQGLAIGNIGMTGYATGPHVHFEIWIGTPYKGGHRVNPCLYLGC